MKREDRAINALHALEAENSVLGCLLLDNGAWDRLGDKLKPEHFYDDTNRLIFAEISRQLSAAKNCDVITVATAMGSHVSLADLTTLAQYVPSAANLRRYADLVIERYKSRQLMAVSGELMELAGDHSSPIGTRVDQAQSQLAKLIDDAPSDEWVSAYEGMTLHTQVMEDRAEGKIIAWPTGLYDFDEFLEGGLRPGELVIVGARPSMGKTALAMTIGASMAEQYTVGLLSMEMSHMEVNDRLTAMLGRVSLSAVKRPSRGEGIAWDRVLDGVERSRNLNLHVSDQGGLNINQVRAKARNLKRLHGLNVLIVDYIGLMSGLDAKANRNTQLEEISRGLKTLAKELQICVLCLAQLNRKSEERPDSMPMMSDLRDCITGEALITNADTGARVDVRSVVEGGLRFNVWAMDESMRLMKKPIIAAWSVGEKDVFKIRTRSGHSIRCSAGHKFRTATGWTELRNLLPGMAVAAPRKLDEPTGAENVANGKALLLGWLLGDGHLNGSAALTVASMEEAVLASEIAQSEFGIEPSIKPEHDRTTALKVVMTTGRMSGAGKNPMTTWLRTIGAWGHTGVKKHIPDAVFGWDSDSICALLRGLFHADGSFCLKKNATNAIIRLSTISEEMGRGVQHLLLRVGICSTLCREAHSTSGYKTSEEHIWTIRISDRANVIKYVDLIGFLLQKQAKAISGLSREKLNDASQFDRLPKEMTEFAANTRRSLGLSHAQLGWRAQGKRMSRNTANMIGGVMSCDVLKSMGNSDVWWDEIVSIEADGREETFDLTVDGLHNFCVNDFITHNCGAIEQDADVIVFVKRPIMADPELGPEWHHYAKLSVAKNRQGRCGVFSLSYIGEQTQFSSWSGPAPQKHVATSKARGNF